MNQITCDKKGCYIQNGEKGTKYYYNCLSRAGKERAERLSQSTPIKPPWSYRCGAK